MKLLPFVILAFVARVSWAAPLQLHNRIVFTRDGVASGQTFFNLKNPNEGEVYTQETVWAMNSAGGEQQQVWRVPQGYGQFGGFSNDGKKALSFNRFNLYVHNLSTKRIQRVLLWSSGWGTYIGSPSFSPDGKQILCEVGNYNGSVCSRVLRLQENKIYSVTKGFKSVEEAMIRPIGDGVPTYNEWRTPCWNPDGKRAVVAGGSSWSASPASPKCQTDLWVMNPDGTGDHQLTQNPAWDLEPTWSADGDTIAFVRRMDTNGGDGYLYSYNLWVADLKSHTEKQVTFLPVSAAEILTNNSSGKSSVISNPRFSPQGTQIAFDEYGYRAKTGDHVNGVKIKNGEPANGIHVIDTDGKNQRWLCAGRLVQWMP